MASFYVSRFHSSLAEGKRPLSLLRESTPQTGERLPNPRAPPKNRAAELGGFGSFVASALAVWCITFYRGSFKGFGEYSMKLSPFYHSPCAGNCRNLQMTLPCPEKCWNRTHSFVLPRGKMKRLFYSIRIVVLYSCKDNMPLYRCKDNVF